MNTARHVCSQEWMFITRYPDDGFISGNCCMILVSIFIIALAFHGIVQVFGKCFCKAQNALEEKERMQNIVSDIVFELENDDTGGADSRFDHAWKYADYNAGEIKVTFSSLSGKINLNFFPESFLHNEKFISFFRDRAAYAETIVKRNKLFNSYEDLEKCIEKDVFDAFFTLYGTASFSVSNEVALKILFENISSPIEASSVLEKRNAFSKGRLVPSDVELSMIYGIDGKSILPYVNNNPCLNVNFCPKKVLEIVLSDAYLGIKNYRRKVEKIVELSEGQEISNKDLCGILGISEDSWQNKYIGTVSYFYEANILGRYGSCKSILMRQGEKIKEVECVWN